MLTCVSVINILNEANRYLTRSLLYLIKRLRPKPFKQPSKKKLEEKEASKVLHEIDTWKTKYTELEKLASRIVDKNEKVMDDNHYLRLELKRIR